MTDVLFITSTEKLNLKYEVHGTMLLATKLLGEGFSASLLRFGQFDSYKKDYQAFIQDVVTRILEINPRCVSFYTLWPFYHIMLRIAKEIKLAKKDCIVILGGPQASGTAQATMDAMEFVDYICTGEGENTVVPFFSALLRDEAPDLSAIPGLFYRKNNTVIHNPPPASFNQIDDIPPWDSRLYLNDYDPFQSQLTSGSYFMPIEVGRGCPFSCYFCSACRIWNRSYRLKSPEKIVEDIVYHKDTFGITSFMFSHDAFTINKRRVAELCDLMIEKDLKVVWKCTSRIDCIDEELVLKMKQAGLVAIELGIETGSPAMQKTINKKLNLESAKEKIAFLLKEKIHTSLYFMYGFPEETEADLNQTLEFQFSALDMGVQFTSMSFCRFNPQTEITDRYFDRLTLSSNADILIRSVQFGYKDEENTIRNHKSIFPFFYHLDTPLRNQYQHVRYLAALYQRFPRFMKTVRAYYKGDNIRMYRDLVSSNFAVFDQGLNSISHAVTNNPHALLYNLASMMEISNSEQLLAVLSFENTVDQIMNSKEDQISVQTYAFSYYDYKLNLPMEAYSKGKTTLKIQKINKKFGIQIVAAQ